MKPDQALELYRTIRDRQSEPQRVSDIKLTGHIPEKGGIVKEITSKRQVTLEDYRAAIGRSRHDLITPSLVR